MFRKLTILLVAFTMVAMAQFPETLTVQFKVNMAQEINNGNFDPDAGDYVEVHGNFTNWGSGSVIELEAGYTNGVDTVVWEGEFFTDMPDTIGTGVVDSLFVFKFVRQPGSAYEGGNDRTLAWDGVVDMLVDTLAWFGGTPFDPNTQLTNIVFTIDMAVQIIGGNFDPEASDILEVRGGFNGWSDAGDDLTLLEGTKYSLAKKMGLVPGANNPYKFVTVTDDGAVTNWESPSSTGGGDRTFAIDGTETDVTFDGVPDKFLEPVFWSDESADDIFLSPQTINFTVDMNNAVSSKTDSLFKPGIDSVYVAGPFNSWLTPDGGSQDWRPVAEYRLDDPDQDGFYTLSKEFPEGTSRNFVFKFGFSGANEEDLDNESDTGENHQERLDGEGPFDVARVFGTIVTSISDETFAPVAESFSLQQNYPNPFNPETTIRFEVTAPGKLSLVIFNALGQKVKTLFNGSAQVGSQQVVWNGTNDAGNSVASGVYYYQMRSTDLVVTKKMTLIK
jgi:hypothetical protein